MLSAERIALLKHGAPPRNALEAALRNVWYGGSASYEKTVGPAPIISINDAKPKPAKSLIVGMEPVQDLHGYANPWPAGASSNIWDEQWEAGIYDSTTGLPASSVSNIRCKTAIPVSAEATYFAYVTGSPTIRVLYYDITDTFISTELKQRQAFTTPASCAFIRFSTVNYGGMTYKNDVAINFPATETSYVPYSNICPISGRTGVTVERTGVNLFDKESIKNIITEHDYQNGAYYCDYIELAPNTTVTVSYNAGETSNVIILLNNIEQVNGAGYFDLRPASGYKTFTTDASGRLYIGVLLSETDANFNARIEACNMQIELGSTASDYSAYSGATYPVTWQDEAGTVYGCTVDVVSGLLTVTHGIVDITNPTVIEAYTYQGNNGVRIPNVLPENMTRRKGICNVGTIPKNVIGTVPYMWVGVSDNAIYWIGILDAMSLTLGEFKTWTETNTIRICYELPTPQTYQLTPQQIALLKGSNVLWSDADDLTLTYIGTTPPNLLGGMLGGGLVGAQEPTEETSEEPTEGEDE